ncbi:PRC-barrel domain-containing protein [Candidatus Woesearchaeota archaeon]|nr:PRC-barrel domain-containing protein [Candidatus Woesearchaeota archaeon]
MGDKRESIEIISPNDSNILKFESIKDYLGKKVVSKSGKTVGSVRDVLFTDKGIRGIIVYRFFSRFYVDRTFFNTVGNKAMLSINPILLLKGKDVFDADGKKLGKVSRVKRKSHTNDFHSIVVKKRFFLKGIEIPKSEIDVMKDNIILNKVYE